MKVDPKTFFLKIVIRAIGPKSSKLGKHFFISMLTMQKKNRFIDYVFALESFIENALEAWKSIISNFECYVFLCVCAWPLYFGSL